MSLLFVLESIFIIGVFVVIQWYHNERILIRIEVII